jgi:hypothetical protein
VPRLAILAHRDDAPLGEGADGAVEGVLEDEQVHARPVHHADVGELEDDLSLAAQREDVQRARGGPLPMRRSEHDLREAILAKARVRAG